MDPMSVLTTMWRQRRFVVPALVLTLIASGYMVLYGPRQYEATISYALVNPDTPTENEMVDDPSLAALNSDNPYLRASNPTLITDVLVTRLSTDATAEALKSQGLSTEYIVARGGVGNGFVLDITGVGGSPEAAQATKAALGDMLVEDLRVIQEVNGADPTYHFQALLIADAVKATEKISSRLRILVSMLLAGAILMFASVSLGEWLGVARSRRGNHTTPRAGTAHPATSPRDEPGAPGGSHLSAPPRDSCEPSSLTGRKTSAPTEDLPSVKARSPQPLPTMSRR